MQDGNYSLVLGFQKVVCQGCGSDNDGDVKKEVAITLTLLEQ
jgi:hypothetical protein